MMQDYGTDRLWDEPVILQGTGQVLRVLSTRDAILCLRNYWPLADGTAKREALSACEKVLEDSLSPDLARTAFVEAAREADFRVNSWTD